jgi:hypothetical protein
MVKSRDLKVIKSHVLYYFKQLLGTKCYTWASFSHTVWAEHECVLDSENDSLIASLSEEEIRLAIFSINPNKSPGLDGFLSYFNKKFGISLNMILCIYFLSFIIIL